MESRSVDTGSNFSGRRRRQFRNAMPKSAVILQPDSVLRQTISQFVQTFEFAHVVGEASETHDALELIVEKRPEVVIADFHEATTDGLLLCKTARSYSPRPRVVFLTDVAYASTYYNRIFKAGASGLILRHAPFVHWLYVMGLFPLDTRKYKEDSSTFVDSYITGLLRQSCQLAPAYMFSKTELATLIRLRMSPEDISAEIELTVPTIKGLQGNIYAALGARNNDEAIDRAEALGYRLLLSPGMVDAQLQESTIDAAVRRMQQYIEERNY